MKQADVEQARQQEQRQSEQSGQAQGQQRERGGAQQSNQPDRNQMREERSLAPRTSALFLSPFTLLQRFFTDDFSEMFNDVGSSRGLRSQSSATGANVAAWVPKIDVVQRGNELLVRADLPGVNPDDVVVEISDDAITISGERQQEREEERGSIYRFERTYGAFYRVIPLPEGAIVDRAKASFKDGVLEITVPAPPEQVSRGRRLEISQSDETKSGAAKDDAKAEANRS
jgi:HSP20 family protein